MESGDSSDLRVKSGAQSLSPSFRVLTHLSFFLAADFRLAGEALGENTPEEAENLKLGGLESQESPRPPAGVTKLPTEQHLGNFIAVINGMILLVLFQAFLLTTASVGDSPALLAALTGTVWVLSPPHVTGSSLSCLPTMGTFAVGTRMKSRC